MPLDYGVHRRRKISPGIWLGAALGLAVTAALLRANWSLQRSVDVEQGWIGAGPDCPSISADAYADRGYRAHERAIVYDGVTLARQYGHVMCKDVDTAGGLGFLTHPVCQFTSPTAIRVSHGGIEAFFEPGGGHVATVSVGHAGPRCELSGRFTLFSDPTNY